MCWISQNAIPNIADKDIECFKVVLLTGDNTVHSYYQEFKYELNTKIMNKYTKPKTSKTNVSTSLLSGSCYTNIEPVYQSPCVEPIKPSNRPHDFYEFLDWLFGWLFK